MIEQSKLKKQEEETKRGRVIVGIDPDVDKNGVAYLDCRTRHLEVCTLSFPDLLDYFRYLKQKSQQAHTELIIVVEAGWLNPNNWHIHSPNIGKAEAAQIGNRTGCNHETGRKIVEMCRHWEMRVEEMKPLKKYWKGKDGKITQEELYKFTGVMGRTNQEGRDAALLAWVYAGFPIKLKV